ncbi:hypothetical protein VF21_06087 [Pseudogymnoascus sp. 05NY08]|nr:hypothetical protein VF21_06087 [Pseudogymnoascus sp. 05NY08]
MSSSQEPSAILSHLHSTDGSATFSQNGYTIIGAVNGPIEVQRRDELPEEAAIDVIVRPAAGVGSTRERHLESIIERTLRQIVLISNFPRTLIQVTLQVTSTPPDETATSKSIQTSSTLPILPALLQTAILALLSAAIPLSTSLTATFLAISEKGKILQNPSLLETQTAQSIHALAFTSNAEPLVIESQGSFTPAQWDEVCIQAEKICCGSADPDAMVDEVEEGRMMQFVQTVVEEKVDRDMAWRT